MYCACACRLHVSSPSLASLRPRATRAPHARLASAAPQRLGASAPSSSRLGGVRHLNLHEYQSKDLLESFGCVVQRGRMAASAADAGSVAASLVAANAGAELVLKAQIHAGGRGKGVFDNGYKGGVKICKTPAEVSAAAARMLGARLVTKQTGPAGQLVSKVLVNEGIAIHRELYFAILMDRAHGGPVLVASTQGGMDIEEVAEKHPGAIVSGRKNGRRGAARRGTAREQAPLGPPAILKRSLPLSRPPARAPR
jgi:hypothetical protein